MGDFQRSSIVILTGAGISAESGIPTFRGTDGLWEGHRIEEVASPQGFAINPDLVHQFYNLRRQKLLSPDIAPNAAHQALAQLEKEYGGEVTVITQNIDNLHERGGSQKVIHMHGELLKMFCRLCGHKEVIERDIDPKEKCPHCQKEAAMRPDIVWFGEMPYHMEEIYSLLENCKTFISIGTSGNVYPAAGFVTLARSVGAHTIEVNLEPSLVQNDFAEHRYGKAGEVVPKLVKELIN